MVGDTISHFRILEELGRGGMGVVYKAHDVTLDRLVALKFLPPYLTADQNEKERFLHEARAAAAINHPNVVTIYEIGEHEGQAFLAMEHVEGETLKNLIMRDPVPIPKAFDLAIQIAEALCAAHERGVVHRDIKADNIIVTPRGTAKVADFGLAKLQGASRLTQAGSTLGTIAYMSPEQTQGEEVDHRTDIFSFGVVLYELLTGRLPFKGEHQAALLYELMNQDPVPLARFNNDVGPELERIVAKALAKDPAERYQHMDDLLADLRRERRRRELERTGRSVLSKESTPPALHSVPSSLPDETSLPSSGLPRTTPRKSAWRYAIPAGVLVAALLLLVVFNPFNFQLKVQQGNAAEQGYSLAVLYFQNIPDPEDKDHTGDMLTDLLTTALSQDKALQVISRERLYDIQKELSQADTKAIPPALAQKVAERAGVSMMLLGSVLQREPSLAITARVVNVKSGAIVSSQRLSGFSAHDIFALVDSLALLVRSDVGPRMAGNQTPETRPVTEVTTSSQEAYRLYLEGLDLGRRFLVGDARAALRRAVELDSNFAMAYFALASNAVSPDEISMRPPLQKAWDLRARVTEKERMQIEAEYLDIVSGRPEGSAAVLERYIEKHPYEVQAFVGLAQKYAKTGRQDKALQTYERLVQRDSLARDAWNILAYTYSGFSRRAEAFRAIERYMNLMPGEPNPFDSKGEIFMMFGEVDSAAAYYQRATDLRPDFQSAEKLGWICVLDGDYTRARENFRKYGATPDLHQKMSAQLDELGITVHQGRLNRARRQFEGVLPQLRQDGLRGLSAGALEMLVVLARETGDYAGMLQFARQLVNVRKGFGSDPIEGRDLLAEALHRTGDAARKAGTLKQLERDMEGQAYFFQRRFQFALGWQAFSEGAYERAVSYFQRTFAMGFPNRAPQLPYGIALLKSGHVDEAITELRRVTWWVPISFPPVSMSNYSNWVGWPIAAVRAHYWLGIAYEQEGRAEEARRAYGKFLDIWKDADFPSPELKDARMRLARLKGVALSGE